MAAETRTTKQYRIYTLFKLDPIAKDEGRVDRVAIAIFSDKKKLDSYLVAAVKAEGLKDHKEKYEQVDEWVETEPVQQNFNVPIDPAYAEPAAEDEGKQLRRVEPRKLRTNKGK